MNHLRWLRWTQTIWRNNMCVYIYNVVLYAIPSHNTHVLLATTVCVIIGLRTHFWLQTCLPCITHILLYWTVSVLLPNHKQFIRVNRMSCIAHATKFWTVFDASVIANVLHLFDGFLHHHLQLWHRTQFRWRVSDSTVTFGPSCSSVWAWWARDNLF